jgi:hypothetical protein
MAKLTALSVRRSPPLPIYMGAIPMVMNTYIAVDY